MKVLLIQIYSPKKTVAVYPIGLAYLSTALLEHDVRIFDQNLFPPDDLAHETAQSLLNFNPEVVGISLRNIRLYDREEDKYLFSFHPLTTTLKTVRQINPSVFLVAGGPAFSLFPLHFMRHEPEIDFGIFLEGEESFPQLLRHIDTPEKVKGVFLRKGGEVVFTGEHPFPRFETFPKPRRDLISPQLYKGDYAIGIQTKRGCPLRCIYCNYVFLTGSSQRLRPHEKVVDEIEHLVERYGVREFSFVDNVFNIPVTHAKNICQEIIKRGVQVRWSAWFNEEFLNEEFLALVLKAGCTKFEFSPDGYSNDSLRWLNKNIQTKQIVNTYQLLRKKPVQIVYNFMQEIPGQNILQLLGLAIFTLRLKIFLRGRVQINFNKLGIEPNTRLEKMALREGRITPDTDLFHPTFYLHEKGIIYWFRKQKRIFPFLKKIKNKLF
jgi:anaerobic magnesium-protoporphyrin IX monomethyl ester cyclase